MDMTLVSCRAFVDALASTSPAPGGGGAAALVGAIATAMGNMAGALAIGKKRYADDQEELLCLNARCAGIEKELLDLVQADEDAFLPLAAAYKLPKDTPNRYRILDEAKIAASQIPLRIMELCCDALDCIAVIARKGSRLAVSDAGGGAILCKAAMQAASLAVYSNTKTMTDREAAGAIDAKVHRMLDTHGTLADEVFAFVCSTYGQ